MSGDNRLTLLHFGDLHVWHLGLDADFAFKRLLGLANLVLRRGRKFPLPLAQMLTERMSAEEADYVLFTGDLTTTALEREFAAGRVLLDPLISRWACRFIAIPGNHDRYTRRATRARLFEEHFCPLPGELPFAIDLDARWSLVAFETAVPRHVSSRGCVTPAMLAALEKLLAEKRDSGRAIIAAGHYPLIYPDMHHPGWEHVLPERRAVLSMLQTHGVRAYMHGHVHHRWRLEHGGIVHLNCGAAAMNGTVPARRPGYLKLTLGQDRVESVQMHWLPPFAHRTRRAEPQDWLVEDLPPETVI